MRWILSLMVLNLVACAHMMNDPALARQLDTANQDVNSRPVVEQKQVDTRCQQSCLSRGFLLDFCNSKCVY
jgi:hypothetical protein